MVHETAYLQRSINMILTEYDHSMAKPPHNMVWLGNANLPKTKIKEK
jgi:hypothetical protein